MFWRMYSDSYERLNENEQPESESVRSWKKNHYLRVPLKLGMDEAWY